jgi:lactate dehydrogenase-like 2-hydroxyacid dehydrogenase
LVSVVYEFQFIGHVFHRTAPVSVAEHRVATPLAFIRASPGGYQRDRTHAVVLSPNIHIALDLNGFTVRKRLLV